MPRMRCDDSHAMTSHLRWLRCCCQSLLHHPWCCPVPPPLRPLQFGKWVTANATIGGKFVSATLEERNTFLSVRKGSLVMGCLLLGLRLLGWAFGPAS